MTVKDSFRKFAHKTAIWTGSPWAFIIALIVIVIWGSTGHLFNYSDTWQLIINTGTTIVTFLMVFLIQATQNRDAREIHIKIDELIRATKDARNRLINLESLSDSDLDELHKDLCAAHNLEQERIQQIDEQKRRRAKKKP